MHTPAPKPVIWMGDSLERLQEFPVGEKHVHAKPLRGLGSGVLEVVSDHRGDTFRAVYAVRYQDRVYVLHAFQKKPKKGIATPQPVIAVPKQRLARAATLHATQEN